jgi:hypothetical protein
MIQAEAIYAPAYRFEGIERLEILDWDEIHDAVQSVLQGLDEPVGRLVAGYRKVVGRNSGGAWALYSYRVYQPPEDSDVDPVVVGVSFSHGNSGSIKISGDISGETLGDVLVDLPSREVMGKLAVVESARNVSDALASRAADIARALADVRRRS